MPLNLPILALPSKLQLDENTLKRQLFGLSHVWGNPIDIGGEKVY